MKFMLLGVNTQHVPYGIDYKQLHVCHSRDVSDILHAYARQQHLPGLLGSLPAQLLSELAAALAGMLDAHPKATCRMYSGRSIQLAAGCSDRLSSMKSTAQQHSWCAFKTQGNNNWHPTSTCANIMSSRISATAVLAASETAFH